MKVTVKDVKYIAALSRLEISDEEMPKFTEQFNQILNYARYIMTGLKFRV